MDEVGAAEMTHDWKTPRRASAELLYIVRRQRIAESQFEKIESNRPVPNFSLIKAHRKLRQAQQALVNDPTDENWAALNEARDAFQKIRGWP